MARNRKLEYRKRTADNRLTKITGATFTKMDGGTGCWIAHQTQNQRVPIHKIAYAAFSDWQPAEMTRRAMRMRLLRVKQSCGVDQCVNPAHLVGTEKEFKPWG